VTSRSARAISIGVCFAGLATACTDASAPEGEAPELPPPASFIIDFSDFTRSTLAASEHAVNGPAGHSYWERSAVVVGAWNLILTTTLAPPVAAFVASFSHQPEWSDGAWTWPYDFDVRGIRHSARLEARHVSAGVRWDMYISKEGAYTDCHWYTGVSNISGTAGTWLLSRGPTDSTAFIAMAWNRASAGATYDIRYTNVVAGANEYGSYITYGVTGDTPYDAYFVLFYGAQADNLTEIEWSRTTKAGRTRDPAFFQDSAWRCWASDHENATCQ
jgi:hypothetical protein